MATDGLQERLEALERAHRRTKAGGAAGWVLALAILAMGQAKAEPKVLRAEGFEVVDPAGKVLASLGRPPSGKDFMVVGPAAALSFFDAAGRPRVMLDYVPDGAGGLVLSDGAMKPRALLAVAPDGAPSLFFGDAAGKARAAFDLGPDGFPYLRLSDRNGKERIGLSVDGKGVPRLIFKDAKGRNRMTHAVENDGTTGFSLWNEATGKPRLILTADEDGKTGFCLFDGEGRGRTAITLLPDGSPRIDLLDKDGKELFRATK